MASGALEEIDVLVLAGGLGTRLGSLLPDLPKVLAPVAGRPFLEHLLEWFVGQGARRVVLGLGSRAEAVLEYLAAHAFAPLDIQTVVEPQTLGTAGAIGYAWSCLKSDPVIVMNGDTFVDADLGEFLESHRKSGAGASVLCALVNDPQRYGSVAVDSRSRISRFREKCAGSAPGLVNAGIYLFNRAVLAGIARISRGSLERDVLEAMPPGSIHAFASGGCFHDIGTPESLAGAAAFLEKVTA